MVRKHPWAVVTSAACLILGISANRVWSQPSPSPAPSPSSHPSNTVGTEPLSGMELLTAAEALNFLHHVNSLEIQEGQSAMANAQAQSTRAFAQTLVTDHRQNEQQVQKLAADKGVPIFVFQPATYEAAVDSLLLNLSGTSAFDEAFMQLEASTHQDVLHKLQSLEGQVNDPEIKSLISQTIPVVQHHIDLASASPQPSGTQPSSGPSSGTTPSP